MNFPVPDNETERLSALRRYGILDTPPEREFDDLVALAAEICGTPMALMSLVDADRQWFKAKVGVAVNETPRDVSLCAHAILQRGVLVVPDTLADERFARNPLVTGEPHIRFYAGAPLTTPDGQRLGTLCVIDHVPRQLNGHQTEALQALSRQVVSQLELRRSRAETASISQEARRTDELLRAIIEGTATVTGREFFHSLVKHLATGLHVRYSFIAECLPNLRARSLAFWVGSEAGPGFEYDLHGTPCLNVTEGRTCHYDCDLQRLFPEDKPLVDMRAESYLGVPVRDSAQRVIGHLVIIDDKPMPNDPLVLSVMEIFAARAGVELERARAFEDLRRQFAESEERFRDLFDEAPIAYVHEDLDPRFIRANRESRSS